MKQHTLRKSERLCHQPTIESIFKLGKTHYAYPFKILTLPITTQTHPLPQVLIVVSKRTFKHAVDRNRIKRLIREAYRKNKTLLTIKTPPPTLAIIYVGKTILPAADIERKLILILQRISKKDEENTG